MASLRDEQVLRYAGALGHRYVVVIDSGSNPGARHAGLQTSDRGNAVASACGEFSALRPVVYERTRKGWKKALAVRA